MIAIALAHPQSRYRAITRWLETEMERLDVNVTLNSLVDPDLIDEINPDRIVLATGSTPRDDGFQLTTPISPLKGFDLNHVYTSWDIAGWRQSDYTRTCSGMMTLAPLKQSRSQTLFLSRECTSRL